MPPVIGIGGFFCLDSRFSMEEQTDSKAKPKIMGDQVSMSQPPDEETVLSQADISFTDSRLIIGSRSVPLEEIEDVSLKKQPPDTYMEEILMIVGFSIAVMLPICMLAFFGEKPIAVITMIIIGIAIFAFGHDKRGLKGSTYVFLIMTKPGTIVIRSKNIKTAKQIADTIDSALQSRASENSCG